MTAYLESTAGLVLPNGNGRYRLTESDARVALTIELLESRIGQLEIELQEQGWMRLNDGGAGEFTRDGLGRIVELARVMYLKNPLIKRIADVGKLYVWGQDLSVDAADAVKPVVDRFDADNDATLTGQQASGMLDVELRITGNLFLAFFTNPATGAVKVRHVPFEEIKQIVTNPEDRAEVWYYLREWSQQPLGGGPATAKRAYYPHIDYRPDGRPEAIETSAGAVEIRWESPIDHVKVGSFPHWRWGVSEVYAALDWARAYKQLLEDDATRSKALARFAWKATAPDKRGVAAVTSKLGTTLGAGSVETNPPPVAGSVAAMGPGYNLDPIRVAGATLDPDHSRPARLMVAAAAGLPDTTLSGDVDQSSLATSQSMDRPTHLQFSEDRKLWVQKRQRWYRFAIEADLAASGGLLRGIRPTADELNVSCEFPDLLEPDSLTRIQTIEAAAAFMSEETTARLMLSAIGVENVDDEIAKWQAEKADRAKKAAAIAKQQPPQPPADPSPPPANPTEAKRTKAGAELGDAIKFFDKVAGDKAGLLGAAAD